MERQWLNRIRMSEMERAYLRWIGTDRWWDTEGALREKKCGSWGEEQRKIGMEGWMEGRGERAMKGSCSTCDGWALAQVWRRDQIKSLSRQQWTGDKVITFPPSLPAPSPPSSLCVYHPQSESQQSVLTSLSSALSLEGGSAFTSE